MGDYRDNILDVGLDLPDLLRGVEPTTKSSPDHLRHQQLQEFHSNADVETFWGSTYEKKFQQTDSSSNSECESSSFSLRGVNTTICTGADTAGLPAGKQIDDKSLEPVEISSWRHDHQRQITQESSHLKPSDLPSCDKALSHKLLKETQTQAFECHNNSDSLLSFASVQKENKLVSNDNRPASNNSNIKSEEVQHLSYSIDKARIHDRNEHSHHNQSRIRLNISCSSSMDSVSMNEDDSVFLNQSTSNEEINPTTLTQNTNLVGFLSVPVKHDDTNEDVEYVSPVVSNNESDKHCLDSTQMCSLSASVDIRPQLAHSFRFDVIKADELVGKTKSDSQTSLCDIKKSFGHSLEVINNEELAQVNQAVFDSTCNDSNKEISRTVVPAIKDCVLLINQPIVQCELTNPSLSSSVSYKSCKELSKAMVPLEHKDTEQSTKLIDTQIVSQKGISFQSPTNETFKEIPSRSISNQGFAELANHPQREANTMLTHLADLCNSSLNQLHSEENISRTFTESVMELSEPVRQGNEEATMKSNDLCGISCSQSNNKTTEHSCHGINLECTKVIPSLDDSSKETFISSLNRDSQSKTEISHPVNTFLSVGDHDQHILLNQSSLSAKHDTTRFGKGNQSNLFTHGTNVEQTTKPIIEISLVKRSTILKDSRNVRMLSASPDETLYQKDTQKCDVTTSLKIDTPTHFIDNNIDKERQSNTTKTSADAVQGTLEKELSHSLESKASGMSLYGKENNMLHSPDLYKDNSDVKLTDEVDKSQELCLCSDQYTKHATIVSSLSSVAVNDRDSSRILQFQHQALSDSDVPKTVAFETTDCGPMTSSLIKLSYALCSDGLTPRQDEGASEFSVMPPSKRDTPRTDNLANLNKSMAHMAAESPISKAPSKMFVAKKMLFTVEEVIQEKYSNESSPMEIKAMNDLEWAFTFLYDSLELVIKLETNKNSIYKSVMAVCLHSRVTEKTDSMGRWAHHVLLAKWSNGYLKSRCKTTQQVPKLLDDFSAAITQLAEFIMEYECIRAKELVRMADNKISFDMSSMEPLLWFRVTVDLSHWEIVLPSDISIQDIVGHVSLGSVHMGRIFAERKSRGIIATSAGPGKIPRVQ
uniref:Uncharacterized protein n=1 Tax=Timema cristinae TaxID=61476 RepID=A0A7R9C9J2_TIMCR|nr:unnamed protein product [Timema cristinae]